MIRTLLVGVGVAALFPIAGCGSGGGGGSDPVEVERVLVIPHVLETSGTILRVAAGDVNGDGVMDLVTIRESPTLHVTLQLASALRESPTLQSKGKTLERGAAAYETEGSAHVLAWNTIADLGLCDMDLDGAQDLVIAGGAAHAVGVWRCDPVSRSEFLSPWVIDTAGPTDRVATGDVNGDGRPDIVTMDESTGQARVFLQSSASPLDFVVGNDPPAVGACHGLVLADVDRDGRLDLVTNDAAGDRLRFLFSEPVGFAVTLRESPTRASTGKSMAVGDVDGDGWLDVVVVDEGGLSLTCLHQRPDSPRTFDDVHSPSSIAVNEEGTHNVAQISIDEPGVHFADSPAGGSLLSSFGPPRVRESPSKRCAFTQAGLGLADLDRDGRLDVVCVSAASDPESSPVVLFGSQSTRGGFESTAQRAKGIVKNIGGGGMAGLCIADLDNDGRLDVAACVPATRELLLDYFETGDVPTQDQFYRQTTSIDGTVSLRGVSAADIDRDGRPDLLAATSDGLQVRFQDAASPGTYGQPVTLLPGADCRCLAVGDLNHDGCPDVIVGTPTSPTGGATLLRDPLAPRTFLPAIQFPPSSAFPPPVTFRSLAIADVDGDGHLDMVCIRESPTLPSAGVCRGMGNGFFDVFAEVDLGPGNWVHVAAGDVNGDGRCDVVACAESPDGCALALRDPPGTGVLFGPPQPLALMGGVRVAVGDVNGDGRADIVTSGRGGVLVVLQSFEVTGRFLPAYALSRETCGGLTLGDFDRDGRVDACFVESKTGTLTVVHGDPDFDLLRVVSLNGLPPGVPWEAFDVIDCDDDCDDRDEIFVACPTALGALPGSLHRFSSSPPGP